MDIAVIGRNDDIQSVHFERDGGLQALASFIQFHVPVRPLPHEVLAKDVQGGRLADDHLPGAELVWIIARVAPERAYKNKMGIGCAE
jgi:hypothetical protein